MRNQLRTAKRIVIKVGTSILTSEKGRISKASIARIARPMLELLENSREAVIVSSGAIAFGMQALGLKKRPAAMARLQASAAIGQGKMMHAYEDFFAAHGRLAAQILLTRDGLENRTRFLTARRTFFDLFKIGAIPIVNENDTVAVEEIAFGDNDILSVHVAHLVNADLLILLSDVDGFFLKDGTRVSEVKSIREIDHKLEGHLSDRQKEKTVGGMRAKLKAARVAMGFKVPLLILNGREEGGIHRALEGQDIGTLFHLRR